MSVQGSLGSFLYFDIFMCRFIHMGGTHGCLEVHTHMHVHAHRGQKSTSGVIAWAWQSLSLRPGP